MVNGQEYAITGIVKPSMDDGALDRETRKLEQVVEEASTIRPNLDLRGVGRRLSNTLQRAVPGAGLLGGIIGRGGGAGGGDAVGAAVGGEGIQAAQLEVLDDIHDELEKIGASGGMGGGGGGGAGGLLTGLGIGRAVGGGGTALAGLGMAGLGTAGAMAGAPLLGTVGILEWLKQEQPGSVSVVGEEGMTREERHRRIAAGEFAGADANPMRANTTGSATGVGIDLPDLPTIDVGELSEPSWLDDLLGWEPPAPEPVDVNRGVPSVLTDQPDSQRDASLERHFRQGHFEGPTAATLDASADVGVTEQRAFRTGRTGTRNRAREKRPIDVTINQEVRLEATELREVRREMEEGAREAEQRALDRIEQELSGSVRRF